MRRTTIAITAALALTGFLAAPGGAQTIAGWSLGADGEVGYFASFRSLGKNGSGLIDLTNLQTTADFKGGLMFGGGIVATSPSGLESLKLSFHTTTGGEVEGGLAVCGEDFLEGDLCFPVITTADVRNITATMSFLRGRADAFIRPAMHVGVGMRQYSFGEIDCTAPGDWEQVCEFTQGIWQNSDSWAPFLTGGVGLESTRGRLRLFLDGHGLVGRFPGQTAEIDSAVQTDLMLTGGVSVRFR